jgi:hypothetical protein
VPSGRFVSFRGTLFGGSQEVATGGYGRTLVHHSERRPLGEEPDPERDDQ